jgi:hypothetical protein
MLRRFGFMGRCVAAGALPLLRGNAMFRRQADTMEDLIRPFAMRLPIIGNILSPHPMLFVYRRC